jgi:hypothetical protein
MTLDVYARLLDDALDARGGPDERRRDGGAGARRAD